MEKVPAGPHQHRDEEAGEKTFTHHAHHRRIDPAAAIDDQPIDPCDQPTAGAFQQRADGGLHLRFVQSRPAHQRFPQPGPRRQADEYAARLLHISFAQADLLHRLPGGMG